MGYGLVDFSRIPNGWILWHMTGPQPSPSGRFWFAELHRISDKKRVSKSGLTPAEAFDAAVIAADDE